MKSKQIEMRNDIGFIVFEMQSSIRLCFIINNLTCCCYCSSLWVLNWNYFQGSYINRQDVVVDSFGQSKSGRHKLFIRDDERSLVRSCERIFVSICCRWKLNHNHLERAEQQRRRQFGKHNQIIMIVSSKSHFLAVSLLQCRRALCECLLVRQICHNILSFHSVSGGGKTATVDLSRKKSCRDGGKTVRLCTVNLECEFEKHNFRQVRIFVGIFSVRVDDDWRWKQKERTRVSIWIFVFLPFDDYRAACVWKFVRNSFHS